MSILINRSIPVQLVEQEPPVFAQAETVRQSDGVNAEKVAIGRISQEEEQKSHTMDRGGGARGAQGEDAKKTLRR